MWDPAEPGVLTLPSGRRVRGRGLHRGLPVGPLPDFGLYLLGRAPEAVDWESRWLRWPDFRLPSDRPAAAEAFAEILQRADSERVEVACRGGRGRTGTALACVAILDGVAAESAVEFVRKHYDSHAVETPGQRRYVRNFAGQ